MNQEPARSRTLVVSTCGTSVLTNSSDIDVRRRLSETTNCREGDIDQQEREFICSRIREQEKRLADSCGLVAARRTSAELNGIIGFYEGDLQLGRNDQHILIHTDTWQGEQVAEILADWLRSRQINAMCQKIQDLNTSDVESFHSGMNELVRWCEETLTGYRNSGYLVVFNLTGGFKSLQGFMQALGMFYADEMVYIFETGESVLRIPRLPIQIEPAAADAIRKHLTVFRRLNDPVANLSASDGTGVPETFVSRIDDQIILSPWGRMIWGRYKQDIYRENILDPISDRLKFSRDVELAAKRLQPERLRQFNERMDDLSQYLDSNRQRAINRLDFKQLKGNLKLPSTHECDLWADQDAWRAFGHFKGETFVVDSIGPGLH